MRYAKMHHFTLLLWVALAIACTQGAEPPPLGAEGVDAGGDARSDTVTADNSAQCASPLCTSGETIDCAVLNEGVGHAACMRCDWDVSKCQSRFRITFDYSYDTKGFFDAPERRAALEAGAAFWTRHLPAQFPAVPMGTKIWIDHPESQLNAKTEHTIDSVDQDLLIFVGSDDSLSGGGVTRSNFYTHESWSSDEESAFNERRNSPTRFQPFSATISFNPNRPRPIFFDTTPDSDSDIPSTDYDFINTAIHEVGHALGITRFSAAFTRHHNVTADRYVGPAASAHGATSGVVLADGSHFEQDAEVGGELVCMDPTSFNGQRRIPSQFEISVLADIGYELAAGRTP